MDRLTKEQTGWKKDGFQNIPKISCVNPNDMKALLYIFNNKIKFNYNCMELKIFKEDEWDKDNNKFKCAFCNIEFSRKSNFSKHCMKQHNVFDINEKISKIYDAYEHINKILISYYHKNDWNKDDVIDLYKFILKDIDVVMYDCDDQNIVKYLNGKIIVVVLFLY